MPLSPLSPLSAQAQEDNRLLRLNITNIDSTRFPTVDFYLDISPSLSLEELDVADFQLSEAGQTIPPDNIQLTEDSTQPTNFVFVLDRSTEPENWGAIQRIVLNMFDYLRPIDPVALLTFYDEVELIQGFSQDKSLAKNLLTNISAGGDFTALYQATLRAATLAENVSSGQSAIILIGDSQDNISTTTAQQLLAALPAEQTIPIYAFGFGPKVAQTTIFSDLAAATGGVASLVDEPTEIEQTLLDTIKQRQQSYRLRFTSALPINDNGYDFALELTLNGAAAQTAGRFVALESTVPPTEEATVEEGVTITVPGVLEGDTVAGNINLTAIINGEHPIVDAEYRIDGKEIAQVESLEYSIVWNSNTVAVGPHVLEIILTDDQGQQFDLTRNFNVVQPIELGVQLPPQAATGLVVGERITVTTAIKSLVTVQTVDFFVADVQVGSADAEPYQIILDSSTLTPGNYTLVVRAEDILGRVVTKSVPLQIASAEAALPPSPPQADSGSLLSALMARLQSLFASQDSISPSSETAPTTTPSSTLPWGFWLLLLTVPLLAYMVLRTFLIPRPKRKFSTTTIALANQGNSPSRYQIYADDPDHILHFEFALEGIPLNRPLFRRPLPPKPRQRANSAGVSRSIIQGKNPFRQHNRKRNHQGSVADKKDKPSSGTAAKPDKVYELQDKVEAVYTPLPIGPNEQPLQSAELVPDGELMGLTQEGWIQLPAIGAGETAKVDMLIQPLRQANQPRLYRYRVISRCLDRLSDPPIIEQSQIQIEGQSGLRPWLSLLLFLIAIFILFILLYS